MVQMVKDNPRTINAQTCHVLEAAGTQSSEFYIARSIPSSSAINVLLNTWAEESLVEKGFMFR